MTLTARVASFAARLTLSDIPDSIIDKAKLHLLDLLGCGLAGADSTLARQAREAQEAAPGPCPVIGTSLRLGPASAAFANGMAMNALDFDDGYEVAGCGMGHPGATIIAALLGAPFASCIDGASFLAALVAGYEVNGRLIEAMQPSHARFREVYGVCQHQGVGAAIAFGRARGLDAAALENAMGFAGTLAPVPSLRNYNWARRPLVSLKDFNAPTAESGVRAVQMHEAGLVGARDVLSGLWMMLGSDHFDEDKLVGGLGVEWRMEQASFKPFPTCRWMHTALEALADILRDKALAPHEIERITIHTSAGLARDFMPLAPATMVDAQFSLPCACAALVLGVTPASAWYTPEALRRTDIAAFAQRVVAEVDPAIDVLMSGPTRRPAGRVTVQACGQAFASPLIDYPFGTRERPMAASAVEAKFLANAAPVLGGAGAQALMQAIARLEAAPDVAVLLARELLLLPASSAGGSVAP